MHIATMQMRCVAYFLFEHPAYTSSCDLASIIEAAAVEGVDTVVADQCIYGLTTPNADLTAMVPAKHLSRTHQLLSGGRASKAQEYTYTLCRARFGELTRQKQHGRRKHVQPGQLGVRQLKLLISRLSKRDFL